MMSSIFSNIWRGIIYSKAFNLSCSSRRFRGSWFSVVTLVSASGVPKVAESKNGIQYNSSMYSWTY
jgi:hypothetical protein